MFQENNGPHWIFSWYTCYFQSAILYMWHKRIWSKRSLQLFLFSKYSLIISHGFVVYNNIILFCNDIVVFFLTRWLIDIFLYFSLSLLLPPPRQLGVRRLEYSFEIYTRSILYSFLSLRLFHFLRNRIVPTTSY